MKWLLLLFGIVKLTKEEQEAKELVEAMRERERQEELENRKHDFLLNVSAPRGTVPPVAARTTTTRSGGSSIQQSRPTKLDLDDDYYSSGAGQGASRSVTPSSCSSSYSSSSYSSSSSSSSSCSSSDSSSSSSCD